MFILIKSALNIFTKHFFVDVCQSPIYVSECVQNSFEKNEQISFNFYEFSLAYTLISYGKSLFE